MPQRPIVLEIPASSAHLTLVRAAASAVCARLGYPVDSLDDLALAVSEGAALLISDAAPGSKVRISLAPVSGREVVGVDVELSVRSASGHAPRPTSFTWTVLASLVSRVTAEVVDDTVTLRLRSRQEAVQR